MGFRKEAYCTVWDVQSISNVNTKGRISISRKDKQTGEYVDDFSGFVNFVGTTAANAAMALKKGDRIRLGDVDVKTRYDKEKNVTYYNFHIYSFDPATNGGTQADTGAPEAKNAKPVDDGEIDDSRLPF